MASVDRPEQRRDCLPGRRQLRPQWQRMVRSRLGDGGGNRHPGSACRKISPADPGSRLQHGRTLVGRCFRGHCRRDPASLQSSTERRAFVPAGVCGSLLTTRPAAIQSSPGVAMAFQRKKPEALGVKATACHPASYGFTKSSSTATACKSTSNEAVKVFTRRGHDWTKRYPWIVEAAL